MPTCILLPEEEVDDSIWTEHTNGVVTHDSWELSGMPVWSNKCVVCGCQLKETEVDLCSKCEEDYEIE